jgi:type II secretory pathway component HofQ
MANPKVLALNKQRGEVIVGRRDGYLTTTVTETAAVQTVEFLETGTQLIFRPYFGD